MNTRQGVSFSFLALHKRARVVGPKRAAGAGLLLAGMVMAGAIAAGAQQPVAVEYVGAGSCSGSNCHGSIRPKQVPQESRIQQNEHTTWVQDRHRRAYEILTNTVSKNMARILGPGVLGGQPPEKSARCLACHGLPPDQKRRNTYDLEDGVSCELCHGPAARWLGDHTASTGDRAKDHARNVQIGLYDTRDLVKRTERCLECHIGSDKPNQNVDHELIGAGHPDLVFELDSFMAVMPMHWKEPDEPLRGMRNWATGGAAQIKVHMERIIRRAGGTNWPEFSELDCFACHHSLTKPESSWRLTEGGYYGRRRDYRTGDVPFNAARFAVFRQMVAAVDGGTAQRLEAEYGKLTSLMSKLNPPKNEVIATARNVAQIADGLAQRLNTMNYEPATAMRVMRAICGDAENISMQGPRVAEHATMALDSLYRAYRGKGQAEGNVRAAIDNLYRLLDSPSAYDGRTFAEGLKRVGSTLQ